MGIILGIDFDNTLVNYDNVLFAAALRDGLITSDTGKNKRNIRDRIRALPSGEIKWQKLQAYAYGRGMKDSELFDGVRRFFNTCRVANVAVFIISHKTNLASMDKDGVNLRVAAIEWMKQKQFFGDDGLGLSTDEVYFESTRRGKIERIKKLGCTHFIDDLEETFLEPSFPSNVQKILYARQQSLVAGVKTYFTWKEIYEYFFEGNK